jgi:hypothetical protein
MISLQSVNTACAACNGRWTEIYGALICKKERNNGSKQHTDPIQLQQERTSIQRKKKAQTDTTEADIYHCMRREEKKRNLWRGTGNRKGGIS